jgi:hypothetical protein
MTESVKLSFLEWTNVVMAVVEALGVDRATGILQRALGVDRANTLIRDKKGPALSKEDNRAIVRELYKEPITGRTRDEKINWAIAVGRKAFDSDERLQEVLQFVLRRIQEDEDAGGTINNPPPTPVPDLPNPGTPPAGADNNFLWKPVGESTKKLVVLTPWSISVEPRGVMTVNGETGNYTGLHNGSRGHHRFSKPGSAYGSNIRVEYKWRNRTYVWTVPNGGSRYTSGVPKPEGGTAPAPVSPVVGSWKPAASSIRAAMVTPLFVMKDLKATRQQVSQLATSSNFNSVVSLVDLQTGPTERQYIVNGRDATRLSAAAEANIRVVLDAGLTPILIVRNDWASRTKKNFIPSVGGPSTGASFYSGDKLANERKFLSNLKWLYPHAHFQLNIEPDRPESANFALEMAKHLRAEGFKGKLIVNPYSNAVAAHQNIRSQLNSLGVVWARSKNSGTTSEDPIFNSDGNTSLNAANAAGFIDQVRKTGKEYIIWSRELANSSGALPDAYLGGKVNPAPAPTPAPTPANQFEYLPDATGVTLRIPYKHWQLHIFSRRRHFTLYGPDKTGKDVYRLNMTGQQLKDASLKVGDDGSLLVFVNTNTELTGTAKNAGWRIMNPLVAVRGDGSRLKPGENK